MRPIAPFALAVLLPIGSAAAGEPVATSPFGVRADPFGGARAVHHGVDLRAPTGAPVLAAAGGVVRIAGWRGGYGLMIEIAHPDATTTRYAHLSRIRVRPAQIVAQGDMIGDVGSTGRATGSHLHFEYRVAGVAVDPLHHLGHQEAPALSAAPEPLHRSAFAAARDRASDAATSRLADGEAALRRLAR